jgi:1-acyl-sn-glycerol-3-phosphate acyltransferase
LIYTILKAYLKIVLRIYCRALWINNKPVLNERGPILFAVNHPNSFLDAVLIGIQFRDPVWFLARGDVFKKKWHANALFRLKVLPVFRLSEGKENLHRNDGTFDQCRELFAKKDNVLIFSEGACENEWKLRALKKGTARLAFASWADPRIGQQLKVIPVTINYDCFKSFHKSAILTFHEPITKDQFDCKELNGEFITKFNQQLKQSLTASTLVINQHQKEELNFLQFIQNNQQLFSSEKQQKIAKDPRSFFEATQEGLLISAAAKITWHKCALTFKHTLKHAFYAIVLLIPALLGMIVNGPFYYITRTFVRSKFYNSVFYDSVIAAAVVLFFPIYAIAFFIALYFALGIWPALVFLLFIGDLGFAVIRFRENWHAVKSFFLLTPSERAAIKKFISGI